MSFFKKIKAAYSSGMLESEIENQYLALQKLSPDGEMFERLALIWRNEMLKRQKPVLALNADASVHFWIIATNNAKEACKCLARQISAYTTDGFQQTLEFREMEQVLYPVMVAYEAGRYEDLNSEFRSKNPKSYAYFITKYGRGPFYSASQHKTK